jgi:hypothetical protein
VRFYRPRVIIGCRSRCDLFPSLFVFLITGVQVYGEGSPNIGKFESWRLFEDFDKRNYLIGHRSKHFNRRCPLEIRLRYWNFSLWLGQANARVPILVLFYHHNEDAESLAIRMIFLLKMRSPTLPFVVKRLFPSDLPLSTSNRVCEHFNCHFTSFLIVVVKISSSEPRTVLPQIESSLDGTYDGGNTTLEYLVKRDGSVALMIVILRAELSSQSISSMERW